MTEGITTREQPIESHEAHSERLMRHAIEQLELDDRLQASEKAWGAVAHKMKVVAERRGWQYKAHRHAYEIVDRLTEEMDDPRVQRLFNTANTLHQNFYTDEKPISVLRRDFEDVKELLEILESTRANGVIQ